MSDKRRVKGGVIRGYFDFVRHQWGSDGVRECGEAIGLNPQKIKEDQFYPAEIDEKILRWISETKGSQYVQKAGNHTVKNLGVLSYLVKFVNIKHLLKKAKDNYNDAFDYGDVSILTDEFGKRAVVIMKNCNITEESCNAWLGAFEGMMEITRTKGSVKLNKRQINGDDYDEFILDWS
jgi:hypothetical protein